jgi:DNA polymerase-3 subunit gamma/tau
MSESPAPSEYRVLARKYRPASFAQLVGQEAMVRTLSNAIESGRLAHAFMLTGVRGVGKTTTARIIARALNCTGGGGAEGSGEPTPEPCGECENCRAIAEDRHMDVLEMDAASRTGVDDIRELIDGVRYAPTGARFKIYIVDEVHMLSKNAFNALLKTLEEPPPHVKFIFATTEVRKVPVTVLSRCQRFDLRRVDAETLIAHLAGIAEREEVTVEAAALALIARAAEGSVRDGLSLLDQAIAHSGGAVAEAEVRDMLGLADRAQVLDLFDAVMAGQAPRSLELLGEQYAAGADPAVVLQDMLELCHWLTRVKVVPETADDLATPEQERARGREMAAKLGMPVLARTWQMLLKGLEETRFSASPLAAAEMVLMRLAYATDLPTPAEVVRELRAGAGAAAEGGARAAPPGHGGGGGPERAAPTPAPTPMPGGQAALKAEPATGPAAAPEAAPEAKAEPAAAPRLRLETFGDVVALAADKGEAILHAHLVSQVHLVRFEPGHIEFRPAARAPANLASDLAGKLSEWTGERWVATISSQEGAPTFEQQAAARAAGRQREAEQHPLVAAAIEAFPGAQVRAIRELGPEPEAQTPDQTPDPADDGPEPFRDEEDHE